LGDGFQLRRAASRSECLSRNLFGQRIGTTTGYASPRYGFNGRWPYWMRSWRVDVRSSALSGSFRSGNAVTAPAQFIFPTELLSALSRGFRVDPRHGKGLGALQRSEMGAGSRNRRTRKGTVLEPDDVYWDKSLKYQTALRRNSSRRFRQQTCNLRRRLLVDNFAIAIERARQKFAVPKHPTRADR
jgi:hypothetical protein